MLSFHRIRRFLRFNLTKACLVGPQLQGLGIWTPLEINEERHRSNEQIWF
jgi:hypothetical protein